MYQSDGTYEPYPESINLKIEKAYREKKPSVGWNEEDDRRYEVDFVQMVEVEVGSTGNGVKVKRETAG